ncbi:MAG TPA: Yip1 family protein [Spongiibacteraceae bacterium]|jgi:hypothetical protein|nr:Yip1 family protein [Spongiibacteraceae bacterium]HUH38090.1 Yip1 family protein [Spongiibacteraceae bacterium]
MFINIPGLFFRPRQQWQRVSDKLPGSLPAVLVYPLVMALLPAIAWYNGTVNVGWKLGDGDIVRLTHDSAVPMIVLFYLVMVLAVIGIGYMVHWMSATYGAESTVVKGIAIAALTATPLFVAGAVGFLPNFWLDLLVGIIAVCYAVYLLYLGVPIVMGVPEERGFLFASAVVSVCLVALVAIMGVSIIMWDMGAAPSFTD